MLEKITAYNKKHHPEKYTKEKSIGDVSLIYLQKTRKLIKKTLGKIVKFREEALILA